MLIRRIGWLGLSLGITLGTLLGATGCKARDLVPLAEGTWEHLYRPVPSGATEVTFLAFGDFGTGSGDQLRVAEAMERECGAGSCAFALLLGDNIYENGVDSVEDEQWESKFEAPYAGLGAMDFWAILGNHDWRGNPQAQIDYTLRSERWRMPAAQYSIPGLPEWLTLHGLDTDTIKNAEEYREPAAAAARDALCGKPGWRLMFGHHPLHSSGHHGGDPDVRATMEPVIRDCGVAAYFSGHDHHQEHIAAEGYEQFVQGAGAKLRPVDQGTPGQVFAASTLGFAVVRATPNSLQVSFKDEDGRLIYEWSAGALAGR
ncbi:MAG: metallophosphoesterase [Bdellovibrionales bacterium]|nr:metallophosphoesterase [Bdellovibrionales bacterium]